MNPSNIPIKFVAIHDTKNTASFFMHQFRGVELGEAAAIPTCEGLTFLRATNYSLLEQLDYFAEMEKLLMTRGTKLAAGIIIGGNDQEADERTLFCEGLKNLSSDIITISVNRLGSVIGSPIFDHVLDAGDPEIKSTIKSILGIDPAYDDHRATADDYLLQDQARAIRRRIASLRL